MELFAITISRRRRTRNRRVTLSRYWYGRKRSSPAAAWQYVKLYADRKASEQAWQDYRIRAERMDAGVISIESERLKLPLAEIFDLYHENLRRQGRDPKHLQISEWMLTRAAKLGNWSSWSHVTLSNVHKLLDDMEEAGAVPSYRNKVIMRVKAFTRWATPEGWANPLAKLKRVSERGAKRNRARRAAAHAELSALLLSSLPRNRRLAYALAAYNGLRRNEAASLDADDIDLDEGTIKVRWKMGEGHDTIPIHTYVLSLLTEDNRPTMSGRVLLAVPDVQTLVKDLDKVGVPFKDKSGLRLDYHALRHTFSTNLSRFGASSTTRKKLMRHQQESVTDKYTHADLDELRSAIERVPWPRLQKSGLPVGPYGGGRQAPNPVSLGVSTGGYPQNWSGNMGSVTLSGSSPSPSGLRGRIANPLFVGSNPTPASPLTTPGTHSRTKASRRVWKRRQGLLRAFVRAIARQEGVADAR